MCTPPLPALDRAEAYARLEEILSRREFQGWINPFEYIIIFFDKLSKLVASIPPVVQAVIAVLLVLVLFLVIAHWIYTARRLFSPLKEAQGSRADEILDSILRKKQPLEEIKMRALEKLKVKDYREAIRLLYIYFILMLQRRGRVAATRSLTGREIARLVKDEMEEFDRANLLFEKSAYSAHLASPKEASWMLDFVEEFERR